MSEEITPIRFRLTFGKLDALRFIGHLDLAKTLERVLRRAQMPIVYSKGFNPQPKMQLASALPLGISSECEILDIWLEEAVDLDSLPDRLNSVSPPGLRILAVEEVPAKGAALQTLLDSAEYLVEVDEVSGEVLREKVEVVLSRELIEREKRGKTYNLRPLILDLRVIEDQALWAHLSLGDRGTGRLDELLPEMGLSPNLARSHRKVLHLRAEE